MSRASCRIITRPKILSVESRKCSLRSVTNTTKHVRSRRGPSASRYEILSYRRDKARDRLLFDEDLLERIGDRCQDVSGQIGSSEWALQQCLKQVAGRASRALDLRYGEDLRYEAIGRHLEMTAGAVRIMLHRTRETLRRCIERHVATNHDRGEI